MDDENNLFAQRQILKAATDMQMLDAFINTGSWKKHYELIDDIFTHYLYLKSQIEDPVEAEEIVVGTREYWEALVQESEEENS